MPNWCMNKLTIKGKSSRLEEFRKRAEGRCPAYARSEEEKAVFKALGEKEENPVEVLQFNSFVPVPEEVLKAGYDKAGYDWQNANWSTKWGACNASIEDTGNENELVYVFDTAWRDPYNWLMATAKLYPDLKFRLEYDEPGMGFKGHYVFKGGHLMSKSYTEHCGDEEDDE